MLLSSLVFWQSFVWSDRALSVYTGTPYKPLFSWAQNDEQLQDNSKILVTAQSGANLLITFPGGRRVGILADGKSLNEAAGVSIEEINIIRETIESGEREYIWEMSALLPSNGEYIFSLNNSTDQEYLVSIQVTAIDGTYTRVIEQKMLGSGGNYRFNFNKEKLSESGFVSGWRRFL
jgi:hypothetical protein